MSKRYALIVITHFKPAWNNLSEEEQAAFAVRVRRAAKAAGVTPLIGYTLTTPGSFLQVWEADDKARLETFKQKLDALGYKNFYDEVLMLGERAPEWIQTESKT
ncbi:MAG TPA: hypothetical protein VFD70_10980 [Anaerolineae bacterium]|nr:hypothetical protein [Anaerolineae bacterium]